MSKESLKCTNCGGPHLHDNPETNIIKHFPWKKPYEKASKYKNSIGVCTLCKSNFIDRDVEQKKEFLEELANKARMWMFCLQCKELNDNVDETNTPIWPKCKSCSDANEYAHDGSRRLFHQYEDKIGRAKPVVSFSRTRGWEIKDGKYQKET